MTPHPLDDFLSTWESSCGRHAIDLRLRAYRILDLDRRWDRERLRDTLRSVLAFDPDEQRAFDECFDDYFTEHELSAWLAEALKKTPPDPRLAIAQLSEWQRRTRPVPPPPEPLPEKPDQSSPTPRPSTQPTTQASMLVVVLGFAALVFLSVMQALPSLPSPRDAGAVDASIAPPPLDASAVEPPSPPPFTPPPTTTQPTAPAELATTLSVTRTGETAPRIVLPSLFVLALALIADAWMRLRATRPVKVTTPDRKFNEPKVDTLRDRQLDLSWPAPMAPILTRDERERLADRTGFSRDEQRVALHLADTVQATARGGGLLDPVYRPVRRPSVLRVVTPAALDPFAKRFVRAFVDGMRASGVLVEEGHGGPEHGRDDLNLVFVDTRTFDVGETNRWARGGHFAFVELRDRALWDVEVQRLPCGVFPPTFEGLCDALDAARANQTPRCARNDELLSGDNFDRLGNAMRLARAFAATAPLDLAGLDALRRAFTPWLPFMAMQRVVALRGIDGDETAWWCDGALRARLLRGVKRDSALWRAACDWQAARLERLGPPKDSRASLELRVLVLLNRWRRDGTLTRDEYDELLVLRAHPSMRRIVGHLVVSLARASDEMRPADRQEAAIAEVLQLIPTRPPVVLPRNVLVRWVIACALSAIVAVLGVYSIVRYRPVTFAIWGGLQTPTAGVARGDPSEVGCEATR